MAKYTVAAGCGHTVEQQLYGPEKERARRLDWMRSESGKCNACYAAMKREEEAARDEQRIEKLAEQLRAATVTDEQIATLREQANQHRSDSTRRCEVAAIDRVYGRV